MPGNGQNGKSLESWIWDAACSIRGAKEASKYKDYILPLIFVKRLCDVFDDELDKIARKVGSRKKAFDLVKLDKELVRFYLPLKPKDPDEPVWSVIRKLSDKIGLTLTTYLRDIARENPRLSGIIDRVDFNATTHGQRDIDDHALSNLIEKISMKRLGLADVEADIIGRSYEYLIRKFAEGSGQSAGEFYTPKEVGIIMAGIMDPEPGMEIYDPCCGSAGLLIKCQLALEERMSLRSKSKYAPLRLYGQEYTPETWAMANMNMIIHDMEGEIEIGDTFRNPKFRRDNHLQTFDRVVANPMWNQNWFTEKDYDNDELDRFPKVPDTPATRRTGGGSSTSLQASTKKERPPSSSTPARPRAAPATRTPTRKKKCESGSSSRTSSKGSSTCRRTSFTTQAPRASSSSSAGTSRRPERKRSFSSTPPGNSPRATRRTT